ncbi:hypothetical protein NVP1121O_009 [Vibrio phage 1.121.O._10N.286.46.C4]|nr:hypothetical protein NVP1121O_009 [Vibrio phage 1.121.O._10N.286.46.C4]
MSEDNYEGKNYTITWNGIEVQPLPELTDQDKLCRRVQDIHFSFHVSEATGRVLDELAKIPTVDQLLQTGVGLELDALAENLKFKSVREEGETDRSFRARLWTEYYNGV